MRAEECDSEAVAADPAGGTVIDESDDLRVPLCNAGLDRDSGAAADRIDDDDEHAMMPTLDVSKPKQAGRVTMGRSAGAFAGSRASNIIIRAATSDWDVNRFVNESPVASGIVTIAAESSWLFSVEPCTLVGPYSELVKAMCAGSYGEGGAVGGSLSAARQIADTDIDGWTIAWRAMAERIEGIALA